MTGSSTEPLAARPDPERSTWSSVAADVLVRPVGDGLAVALSAPGHEIERIALRWALPQPEGVRILGDAWERSYGELEWGVMRPERTLPWYWLAHDPRSGGTTGMGVQVRPAAFCSWTVDPAGVTLWCDVRSGGSAVVLGHRVLDVATVRAVVGADGEGPFAVHRRLCRALSPGTSPSTAPLVGSNNWYHTYGEFDVDTILADADLVAGLAGDHAVRPFSVVDGGWSPGGGAAGGPWDTGTGSFTDMPAVAERIRAAGARPGLWFRPATSRVRTGYTRTTPLGGMWPLDLSLPESLEVIGADVRRFRAWGYELLKHDFSTFDVLGRFGHAFQGARLTSPGWSFADRSRTTAEILVGLYRVIHDNADGAVVLGCNTVGHLAAGLQTAQRTGDDTSGRQWERTRRMGVNTLAFRLAQHGSFFTVDPDCVPATPQTPWELNRQFLDLVARSGTALFLSVDPASRTPRVDADLRAAVRIALDGGEPGGVEPLDWVHTSAPRRWRTGDRETTYAWESAWGTDPLLSGIE
ncbi:MULTISPECIES: hypothetical protein [unclassified Actinotalea]|uniref:hypothetical protein n=1 Tax=unclassified Actinotalea TaxID=2638618 RepID=UPI001C70C7B1|nr:MULTISPECIES: hypothetical protein [unclassified Actinotalea]